MLWQLPFFPPCKYHVFLSHCREDRDWLVHPLFEALRRQGVIPWLDLHDYPYGRTSFSELRDSILKCRHTIFLVTKAVLAQGRGWCIVELAWADLLQENLKETGGELQAVSLPLFFLDPGDTYLLRSAWQAIRDRGAVHQPENGEPVEWALRRIYEFVIQEEERGMDVKKWLEQDSHFRARLQQREGLIDRITARYPPSIAPP